MMFTLIPLLSFFYLSSPAHACRGGENKPPNELADAISKAKFVFIGQILSLPDSSSILKKVADEKAIRASFTVQKKWKGVEIGPNYSFQFQSGRSCDLGRFAEVGSKWLILAENPGETLATASHVRRLWSESEEKAAIALVDKTLLALEPSKIFSGKGQFSRDCAPWDGLAIALMALPRDQKRLSVMLWQDGLKALDAKRDLTLSTQAGGLDSNGQITLCAEKGGGCENLLGKIRFLEYVKEQNLKVQIEYIRDCEKTQETLELKFNSAQIVCG